MNSPVTRQHTTTATLYWYDLDRSDPIETATPDTLAEAGYVPLSALSDCAHELERAKAERDGAERDREATCRESQRVLADLAAATAKIKAYEAVTVDVVMTHGPGPTSQFVELEQGGRSIGVGEWSERDGHHVLRIRLADIAQPKPKSEPPRDWHTWVELESVRKRLATATAKLAAYRDEPEHVAAAKRRVVDIACGLWVARNGGSDTSTEEWLRRLDEAVGYLSGLGTHDAAVARDSLPTAHRPGEGAKAPCPDCSHAGGRCCNLPQELANDCNPPQWQHFTRRLPVAPAAKDAPCGQCCCDGEEDCMHADGDATDPACPGFKQAVPVAPAETCGECPDRTTLDCPVGNVTNEPAPASTPACPAFARRESKEASNG